MHQVGYNNTQAVLKWAYANFPEPNQIIVGGVSAGALASQIYAKLIGSIWNIEEKGIQLSVIADSYVGLLPSNKTAGSVLNNFGACSEDLAFDADIVDECKDNSLNVEDFVIADIKFLKNTDWLFLNSKEDKTQRYFYQLVLEGIKGFPFPNLLPEAVFYNNISEILNTYSEVGANKISKFFFDGATHGFLVYPRFYTDKTVSGAVVYQAVSDWVYNVTQAFSKSKDYNSEPSKVPSKVKSGASIPCGAIAALFVAILAQIL